MRIFILFFLISISLKAQITKEKGGIYKVFPTKPYKNVSSGKVIVVKNMYGLEFQDQELSEEIKTTVKKFFKEHLNGYKDLKKYTLKLEKRVDGMYVENHKLR